MGVVKEMEEDRKILQNITEPCLRFYTFPKKAVTLGFFRDPKEYLNIENKEILWSKRPTGGGILCHGNDLTFSLFLPKSSFLYLLDPKTSYAYIHEKVLNALKKVFYQEASFFCLVKEGSYTSSFCMETPSSYDILFKEKKIVGGAQKRTSKGFLHQGSIFLRDSLHEDLASYLKNGEFLVEQMRKNSTYLLEEGVFPEAKEKLQEKLKEEFSSFF